ncbi:hypothetical protein PR202_gb19957 [Eleusine coracana subsp. coracana]|uniref:Uncharacterized protein n=1 Tax=Eleusine coracana subsp. coracana TaxID=191504 RepID=A0AAV5FBC1_ELECO|nr:hypothetical protein PR202_gb19957 [Eleusine coracana subsp. coracana]
MAIAHLFWVAKRSSERVARRGGKVATSHQRWRGGDRVRVRIPGLLSFLSLVKDRRRLYGRRPRPGDEWQQGGRGTAIATSGRMVVDGVPMAGASWPDRLV